MAAADDTPGIGSWTRIIRLFERTVVFVLSCLLMVVIAISTMELGWLLFTDLRSVRVLPLDVEELFELFGLFLLVLIGVELLATVKAYLRDGVVQGEVVLEVALIALAQKVIVLDTSRTGGTTLLGLAALILSLAAAFWWVRGSRKPA